MSLLLSYGEFQAFFFPYNLKDWFSLGDSIRNSKTIWTFKNRLLSFMRPVQNNIFHIFDPIGLKFLTRSRFDFSRLNEHRFRQNFQDCIKPLCSCSLEIEDTLHYLLHCHHFNHIRIDFMNSVKSVESLSDEVKKFILLYGDLRLDRIKNRFILEVTLNLH